MTARHDRNVQRAQARSPRGQVSLTVETLQSISGPLPSADELAKYEAIVPGFGERVLTKFEQQTEHRMALENRVVDSDIRGRDRGLIAGSIFGVAVLAASVLFIMTGHEGPGVTALLADFLVYGAAFFYGSETRRRERNKKAGG